MSYIIFLELSLLAEKLYQIYEANVGVRYNALSTLRPFRTTEFFIFPLKANELFLWDSRYRSGIFNIDFSSVRRNPNSCGLYLLQIQNAFTIQCISNSLGQHNTKQTRQHTLILKAVILAIITNIQQRSPGLVACLMPTKTVTAIPFRQIVNPFWVASHHGKTKPLPGLSLRSWWKRKDGCVRYEACCYGVLISRLLEFFCETPRP